MKTMNTPNSGSFFSAAPVSIATGAFMVLVFLLDTVLQTTSLYEYGAFSTQKAIFEGQVWRFITAPFVHPSGGDLLGMIFFFVFFAPLLERGIRRKAFIQILFLGILCSQ